MKLLKIFALAAAMQIVTPVTASAKDFGIQFSSIPVGTKVYYSDYENDKWTETYIGKKGKFFVFQRDYTNKKYPRNKRYYNAAGHMVKIVWDSGGKITYGPQSCDRIIGKCTENYKGRRKNSGKYTMTNTMTGSKTYHSEYFRIGETSERNYTLGKYNLFARQDWQRGSKKRWIKIDKIVTK